jgi:hypothetical protein
MQLRHAFAVAAATAALAACASRQVEVTNGSTTTSSTTTAASTTTSNGMAPMTMTAQLASQGGSTITGTGKVSNTEAPNTGFHATASIKGGTPNATYPWHVHAGHCGDNGPVVGPARDYPPLQADADGNATADAIVGIVMPTGPLYVNVHASPTQMGTIVACGNLTM